MINLKELSTVGVTLWNDGTNGSLIHKSAKWHPVYYCRRPDLHSSAVIGSDK